VSVQPAVLALWVDIVPADVLEPQTLFAQSAVVAGLGPMLLVDAWEQQIPIAESVAPVVLAHGRVVDVLAQLTPFAQPALLVVVPLNINRRRAILWRTHIAKIARLPTLVWRVDKLQTREYMASVAVPVGLPLLIAWFLVGLYVRSAQIKQLSQRRTAVLECNVVRRNLMGVFGLMLLTTFKIAVRLF